MTKIKIKTMFESGVHFGHRSRFWHPKMEPYIYGVRNDIHIINLEKTLPMFNDSLNFIGKAIAAGKNILFVGTKRSASNIIKEEAIRCGMPYVNHRWLGGMMTNYKTIKASIKRLKDLEYFAENDFNHVNKKEGLMMRREMDKLEKNLGGIKELTSVADILFIVDIGYEKIAVQEAKKLGLPIVAVVDTNYNPEGIDYVIPGNDDSISSISFYIREVTNTILEAKSTMIKAQAATAAVKVAKKATTSKDKPAIKDTAADKKTAIEPKAKDKNVKEVSEKKPTPAIKKVPKVEDKKVSKAKSPDSKTKQTGE